jgi:hypothetical protein
VSEINFLKRSEIDGHQWNALINTSAQSLPYAYTWYLDAIAEHWDALVMGNYEAVMPLVWLRKLGVKCLYQPYYCQQLGFFSRSDLTAQQAENFITTATKKFPYININLNPSAIVVAGNSGFTSKRNLLLKLDAGYAKNKKSFAESHRRNIGKAEKAGLHLTGSTELKTFQKFYLGNINPEKENFKPKHEKIFNALSQAILSEKKGEIITIVDKDENTAAASLLIHHQNRIINIINTSSPSGKRTGASHLLFDRIIEKLSGTGKVFDFEGSSIPGVARFYEGFGAKEEVFYNYRDTILKNPGKRFLSLV